MKNEIRMPKGTALGVILFFAFLCIAATILGPASNLVLNNDGTITANGINLTNLNAASLTGNVPSSSLTVASFSPFTNAMGSGSTVWISPTNGNLQCYVITNSGWYLAPLYQTIGNQETIRLTLFSTNSSPSYTVASSNLFSTSGFITTTTNVAVVYLLDKTEGTNKFSVTKLK